MTTMHTYDFDGPDLDHAYSVLSSLIIPRPIALVSTMDAEGRVNVAPFSFFNLLGVEPPIVALGIGDKADGSPKDTARNILATREFVIHLVHADIAEQMNLTAASLPYGESELASAKFTTRPSTLVQPPRLAEALVAMECTLAEVVTIGENRLLLGQVRRCHLDPSLAGTEHGKINAAAWLPIGRLATPHWYCHTGDRFELIRPR